MTLESDNLHSFIGNMKKRIKSFVTPKRSKITIKGWENKARINNENEEKRECGKKKSSKGANAECMERVESENKPTLFMIPYNAL